MTITSISIINQSLISNAKYNIMYINLVYTVYTIINFCIVTRSDTRLGNSKLQNMAYNQMKFPYMKRYMYVRKLFRK